MAKYLYCITDDLEKRILPVKGMRGKPPELIHYRDIAIAVSEIPFVELDPTEENLTAHEKVNQTLLFDSKKTVVPLAFCTIVKTPADVNKLMQEGYYTFKKNLEHLKDKLEVGIKMFCDTEKLKETQGDNMYDFSKEIAETAYEKVKAVALESKLNDLFTPDMIMNATFLLERNQLTAFNEAIKAVDEVHGEVIRIKIAGPIAAYSFVELPDQMQM